MSSPSTMPTCGTARNPSNPAPSRRRRRVRAADLPQIEIACLLVAPSSRIAGRRCLSEQLPYVTDGRVAPILVVVNEDVPVREHWPIFFRQVGHHRRAHAANDTKGSNLVNLASRRVARGAR